MPDHAAAVTGNRRRDDARLIAIELQLRELESVVRGSVTAIGEIRTGLGLEFKTLMFDLDTRYMPRSELDVVFVPRKEHETERRRARLWRWQVPVWGASILVAVAQVIALIHNLSG
jgi:hypothetical protein